MPGADKKIGSVPTGAVCRSCTTMSVSTGASPPEGKAARLSLQEGEAPVETGKLIQERHTAPVGDRVGFFADAGHSLHLLPPEVTLGTSRC